MTEPYYQDDHVTLYHGDALDVLSYVEPVDLFFTSPPYNLGTKNGGDSGMHAGSLAASDLAGGYASYDDAMPQNEYDAWQSTVIHAMWDRLSDDGAIFYNHKPRVQGGVVHLPTEYGRDLPLRQVITWDRGTGLNFSESFLLPKSEWICVWAKPAWRLASRSASQVGDVWRIPPEMSTLHPAPFPLSLPTTAIGITSAQVVCDPFSGSGTTLVAAKAAGRRAIGVELCERYCEIAAKRLSQGVLDFGGAV